MTEPQHEYAGVTPFPSHHRCTCGAKATLRSRIDNHIAYYKDLAMKPKALPGALKNTSVSEAHGYMGTNVKGHWCRCGEVLSGQGNLNGHLAQFGATLVRGSDPLRYVAADFAIATKATGGAVHQPDMVNKAPHYNGDPSGVECIEIVRHRNFNIGNAIKYLWRAGLKGKDSNEAKTKLIEDLKKAIFYIKDEIKRLGGDPE